MPLFLCIGLQSLLYQVTMSQFLVFECVHARDDLGIQMSTPMAFDPFPMAFDPRFPTSSWYFGWTQSITTSNPCQTIVCLHVQKNHQKPGFLRWWRISSIHSITHGFLHCFMVLHQFLLCALWLFLFFPPMVVVFPYGFASPPMLYAFPPTVFTPLWFCPRFRFLVPPPPMVLSHGFPHDFALWLALWFCFPTFVFSPLTVLFLVSPMVPPPAPRIPPQALRLRRRLRQLHAAPSAGRLGELLRAPRAAQPRAAPRPGAFCPGRGRRGRLGARRGPLGFGGAESSPPPAPPCFFFGGPLFLDSFGRGPKKKTRNIMLLFLLLGRVPCPFFGGLNGNPKRKTRNPLFLGGGSPEPVILPLSEPPPKW